MCQGEFKSREMGWDGISGVISDQVGYCGDNMRYVCCDLRKQCCSPLMNLFYLQMSAATKNEMKAGLPSKVSMTDLFLLWKPGAERD